MDAHSQPGFSVCLLSFETIFNQLLIFLYYVWIEDHPPIKSVLFLKFQTPPNQILHLCTNLKLLRKLDSCYSLLLYLLIQLFDVVWFYRPWKLSHQNLIANYSERPYVTFVGVLLEFFPVNHLRSHVGRRTHDTIHVTEILCIFGKPEIC